jgi:hypothetical protein
LALVLPLVLALVLALVWAPLLLLLGRLNRKPNGRCVFVGDPELPLLGLKLPLPVLLVVVVPVFVLVLVLILIALLLLPDSATFSARRNASGAGEFGLELDCWGVMARAESDGDGVSTLGDDAGAGGIIGLIRGVDGPDCSPLPPLPLPPRSSA